MNGLSGRQWPSPPIPPNAHGFSAGHAAVVVAALAVSAAVLFPVFATHHHGNSRQSLCLSNVKQTSVALLLYSQDYDDHMPVHKWMDVTYPYAKNWQIYHCPELANSAPELYGYALERSMAGQHTSMAKDPQNQNIEFETPITHKNAIAPIREGLTRPGRHTGRSVVSYLDGHAKSVDEAEAVSRWPL